MTTETMKQVAAFNPEAKVSFVRPYDAKETALEGYWNVIIRYRQTDKSKAVPPSKMVTIPAITLPVTLKSIPGIDSTTDPVKLLSILSGTLQDGQESIVKYLVDGEGKKEISWADVALEATVEFLTAARVSQRLTREGIEAWASVTLKDALAKRGAAVAAHKGITEPAMVAVQVASTTNRYVSLFGGLAAAVPALKQEETMACQKLLAEANLADDMARSLAAKLHTMLNPVIEVSDL